MHHTPFTIMWMSIPVVAGVIVFILTFFLYELARTWPALDQMLRWIGNGHYWIYGLIIGALLGVSVAIAQVWLIRQRYGFAPRFWYVATIIGCTVSGIILTFTSYPYSNWYSDWLPYIFSLWFVIPVFVQAFALWPHVRRGTLLWMLVGIVAGAISVLAYFAASDYNEGVYALIFGTLGQTFLTAMTLMFLMAGQRRQNINPEALVTE